MENKMNDIDEVSLRITQVAAPVRQLVVESLRNAILGGRFLPGDKLVEKELCELTGVSRTSVREALRQIETEGFVTNIPNKGPVVATVGPREAKEIYQIRAVLEGLAGQLFAELASSQQLASLKKALHELEVSARTGDPREQLKAKAHFYDALLDGAGNHSLRTVLKLQHGRMTLLRATSLSSPGRITESCKELQKIVIAAEARDPQATKDACIYHVERSAAIALGILMMA
jgi:DNA-binding GntR family transcriptional regulator